MPQNDHTYFKNVFLWTLRFLSEQFLTEDLQTTASKCYFNSFYLLEDYVCNFRLETFEKWFVRFQSIRLLDSLSAPLIHCEKLTEFLLRFSVKYFLEHAVLAP